MVEMKLNGKKKMRNMLFICFTIFVMLDSKIRFYTVCTRRRTKTLAYEQQTIR